MKKDVYNLTNPQQSIWYTEQFYPNTDVNNNCGMLEILEKVDFNKLEKAINLFVERKDSFRIKLIFTDPVTQYISDYEPFNVEITDIQNRMDRKTLEEKIVHKPFAIEESLLFHFAMFRYPNGSGGYIVNVHHLVSDAWTAGLVVDEIINLYSALLKGEDLPSEELSYLDYIASEKEYLTSEKFIKDKEYWNTLYTSIPEVASIPTTVDVSKQDLTSRCERLLYTLPQSLVAQINEFCKAHKVSVFNFFMGIYALYIGRISNLEEFVIGTPILNRTTFKEKHTCGMFISTVPLKINLTTQNTFIQFVSDIAMNSLSMLRHQKYPYHHLLEDLRTKNPNVPGLYDILISYQNTRTNKQSSAIPYETMWVPTENIGDSLNIHICDMDDTGNLDVSYDYQIAKYTKEAIELVHKRMMHILEQVLHHQDMLLKEVEIVSAQEKEELLIGFNKTVIPYDDTISFIKIFEQQAAKTPEHIALVFQNQRMSYDEVNKRANSLAHVLRDKGVTNDSIIGIMTNRSLEMMISILAVLKAGGAYIPIDPDYPTERIKYMLNDSKSKLLLSQLELKEKLNFDATIVYVDLDNDFYTSHKENLVTISKPEDLSYIIYTSGSTGMPKGVMLTQKSLVNFYHSMVNYVRYLPKGSEYSIVSITTASFDIFAFETLMSLACGLTLYVTDYFEQKVTAKLEELLEHNSIDILQTTPSIMRFHLDNARPNSSFSKLKYVVLAGEQLPTALVQRIKALAPNCTVYNGYGPSETTIFSTMQDVTSLPCVNIGRPIGNTQIYILDKNLNLLPKATVGEIYIAGDGVGRGYLYKEELTQERFLTNPFLPNSIMYKTGDLGLWLEDGTIECKGRMDNQVKLRGLRVELGEIEEKINSFDPAHRIKSAVIIKSVEGKDSLNAFIHTEISLEIEDLKKYLLDLLPNYMIPSTFTMVEALPFTPNGKIDRNVLQHYEIKNITIAAVTLARNETEQVMIDSICKKLNLSPEEFGIDSNVFDFGADSLSIINILTDLFKYNLNLKVYDFYKHPTIRQLYDNLLTDNEVQKDLNIEKYIKINDLVKNLNTSTTGFSVSCSYAVLLTGATGFLGVHILANLLDHPEHLKQIYCLVRSKNGVSSQERLLKRLHFYFGNRYDNLLQTHITILDADITLDNFGLGKDEFEKLKCHINIVIHCAANVKHYGNYEDFEKTNIVGTRNVIEVCKETSTPLHYISTMTVSGNYLIEQSRNSNTFSETVFFENQQFDQNVYAKSKLIAESIVLENMEQGLIGTIYRIGDLTGRFKDGVFQENIAENAIYLRLKSILQIGAISDDIINNDLEFTPVEYASDAVCKIIWSSNNANRIFHIYNPNMLKTIDLINFMRANQYPITLMEKTDFVSFVKGLSTQEEYQNKISGIINDFTGSDDFIYNYTIKTDNVITCEYLTKLDFEWPILTKEYIDKLLAYMKQVGFIE